MRSFLGTLFPCLIINCCAQKVTVKITHFGPEGKIASENVKVIDRPLNPSDLHFFKKQFNLPHEVPEKLVNPSYKNKMIVSWHNEKQEKNLTSNWNNTYTYDSLSRVTAFTFSGCTTCSSLAYKYTVSYDKYGRIESLRNTVNGSEHYKIIYNDKGDIIQIDYYIHDKLAQSLLTDL